MKKMDKLIMTAITSIFAMTAIGAGAANKGSATQQQTEKCYGIVKAGLNDCATAKASCAGSSTENNQPDAYLFLPKGACAKITGASLTSKK